MLNVTVTAIASISQGATWRPSTLDHLRGVLVLETERGHQVGSIGPAKRGKWMNRDTGEEFDTPDLAKRSVEKHL